MAANHELGKRGESMAVEFLSCKGYKVLATNWVWNHREVDIFAAKDNVLAVVEVKIRASVAFGEPEVWVTKSKQKLIIEAANQFIVKNKLDLEVRFDIISIVFNGGKYKLDHIEDAFYPLL